jgi:AcrR family transcriptional regulator
MLHSSVDHFGQYTEKEAIGISDLFFRLEDDKQRRVRNAALDLFSRFGYDKTSTEQIARAAGISKGMVFHYFGSKQALYEYLCAYTVDFFTDWAAILRHEIEGMDYIQRYSWLSRQKMAALLKNPEAFAFLTMLITHPENQAVTPKTQEIMHKLLSLQQGTLVSMAHSGNTDRFRADLPIDTAKRYITYIIEGHTNAVLASLRQEPPDQLAHSPSWAQFDELLDHLRALFYKHEEDN